jgi:hypothetical protein
VTTTPAEITPSVLKFCGQVVPNTLPVWVPVRVEKDSVYSDCFFNVAAKTKVHGGTVQYGWTIWEEPGLWLEAEFHAVWVDPGGEDRVDITPHEGEDKILFLPDPSRIWQNVVVPNRRFALKDDPLVKEFLTLGDRMDQLKVKYAKPDGTQEIPAEKLLPNSLRMVEIMQELGVPVPIPSEAFLKSQELREVPEQEMRFRETTSNTQSLSSRAARRRQKRQVKRKK